MIIVAAGKFAVMRLEHPVKARLPIIYAFSHSIADRLLQFLKISVAAKSLSIGISIRLMPQLSSNA